MKRAETTRPSMGVAWNMRFLFFLEAVVLTAIFPRFPDLKQSLNLDYGELGVSLLGLPIGTLISLGLSGALIDRIGTRRASMAGILLVAITSLGPPLAWSALSLFVSLMLIGLSLALIEVGMNVDADRTEKWVGRPIMSSCHGFWSLGALAGTGFGALAAGQGLSPFLQMMILSPIVAAIAIATIVTRASIGVPPPSSSNNPTFALPTRAMIGLAAFPVGLQMSEGAAFDWSGIYMRDVVGGSANFVAAAYFAFTLPMAIGRFLGDGLRSRIGPVRLAQASASVGCVSIVLLGIANDPWVASFAWVLLGLGVSVAFPLAVTAAAEHKDRPAPVNVASVFLVAFTSFVIGPPMIGLLANQIGLQLALLSLLPFCLLGLILSPSLKPK